MMEEHLLRSDWPAPARVRAFVTLRTGGTSVGPWGDATGQGGWNLAGHCGDLAEAVARNRERLRALLPAEPVWLEQVHGVAVHDADRDDAPASGRPPVADASLTLRPGRVLAVLTADCLPVVLCDEKGRGVAVAHAGWRGLCHGVLEASVAALRARLGEAQAPLLAWLGPAIGPERFEVGDEVREAFAQQDPSDAAAFQPTGTPGKWWGDLDALARARLARCGAVSTHGGGLCTVSDPRRFYSYRRDRQTGRLATLVWIDPH